LAARLHKSDIYGAEGLAKLARTGWLKRVNLKATATAAAPRIRTQLITARVAMDMVFATAL
jgi:transposase